MRFYLLSLVAVACSTARPVAPAAPAFAPTAFAVAVSGTGRPIIFIPGVACAGSVWDGAVAHFGGHVQAHVLTLAGFAGVPAIAFPMLPKVRDEIIAYTRAHHLDHPVIVGHSFGAFLAYWLLETEPDLFGGAIAIDGMPFIGSFDDRNATAWSVEPAAKKLRDIVASFDRVHFATALRDFFRSMFHSHADLDTVIATAAKSDPRSAAEAIYEMFTHDVRPGLRTITAPVLIIAAGGRMTPYLDSRWQAEIDPIRHHAIVFAPDSRHFVMYDAPEFLYSRLDEFLAQVPRGGRVLPL